MDEPAGPPRLEPGKNVSPMKLPTADKSFHKALAAIKADPKKSSVLVALILLLGFLWLKVMLKQDPFPARLSAAALAAAPTPAPDNPLARRSDATLAALADWTHNPISPLNRNLFAVKLDYYPQDGSKIATTLRAPVGDGFWDQVAKSLTARADQKKERRILIENLQLQAAQLKLQSTLMGSQPRAMINGELVGEGNVVASFRILKIEARRIVVEREGIKLEIQMK
jgi:hypothetical protein